MDIKALTVFILRPRASRASLHAISVRQTKLNRPLGGTISSPWPARPNGLPTTVSPLHTKVNPLQRNPELARPISRLNSCFGDLSCWPFVDRGRLGGFCPFLLRSYNIFV